MQDQFQSDLKRFAQETPVKETASQAKAREAKLTKNQVAAMKEMNKVVGAKKEELTAEQEGKKRAESIRKIESYYRHFPAKLESIKQPKLSAKTSAAELEAHVAMIEHELGMSGGIGVVTQAFAEGGWAIEALTAHFNPLGLQLSGPVSLDATIKANRAQWEPLATELAIKYERYFCMGIEARCISFFATVVMTVHRANKAGTMASAAVNSGKGKEEMTEDLFAEGNSL